MTTPRIRFLVSLALAMTAFVTLGACATAGAHPVLTDESALSEMLPAAIRFDNDGRERVHVYLIGQQREWLLGRAEPGARVALQIPEAALAEDAGSMRLAVLAGQHPTLRAVAAPRAAITIVQPVTSILAQRWMFSQTPGELSSLPIGRRSAEVGRP